MPLRGWGCYQLTALSCVAALAMRAPQSSPGGAQIVTNVLVTSADSLSPVLGVSAGDLEIRSDDQLVDATSWDRAPQAVSVVVLVDVSWSATTVRDRTDAAIKASIQEGLVKHLTPVDRVRIGTFGGELRLSAPFLGGSDAWPADAEGAFGVPLDSRYGPSPIWDAVEAAVKTLQHEDARRAIILFTDGQGTGNWVPRADALRDAARADVAVSVVPSALRATADLLREATEVTGGEYPFKPGAFSGPASRPAPVPLVPGADRWEMTNPTPLLSYLADGLHATFRASFVPPVPDGADHRLEIRSRIVGQVVHARRFYKFS